jgi:hypothetical protein
MGSARSRVSLLASLACLLSSCGENSDYCCTEPGPNGEPGTALKLSYSKEFKVHAVDHFLTLHELQAFAWRHGFGPPRIEPCLNRMTERSRQPHNEPPCIAAWTTRGAPTKAHLTLTITQRALFDAERPGYFGYRIEAYVIPAYEPTVHTSIESETEPRLRALTAQVDAHLPRPAEGE